MKARDKLHTIKRGRKGLETLMLENCREVRLCVLSGAEDRPLDIWTLGLTTIWLTPAKIRNLIKRLTWCLNEIEGRH